MSANTIESYARDLGALAAFAAQRRTDVEALSRKDLEAFVRDLMVSGLAPRSVARSVACIRGFYRFVAVERKQDRTARRRSPPAASVAGAAEVPVARAGRSAAGAARHDDTARASATRL